MAKPKIVKNTKPKSKIKVVTIQKNKGTTPVARELKK